MQNYNNLLSSFEVVEFIGTGAMSYVYKIQHKKSKRFYALKEVFLERKNDILTVISEKNIAHQDINHPNLLDYQSVVVSTRMECLKKFHHKEEKSVVSKNTLIDYGINSVCWQRPSSTLTNESVDKEVQFCNKFKENICDSNEEISLQLSAKTKSEPKKKRKNSVKINKTEEKYFLKNDISYKYYHYLITYYSNFTLYDFILKRNDFLFANLQLSDDLLSRMIINSLIGEEINISFINQLMINILRGVSFLHSKKIVHGDISSHNVFFVDNFIPKLGDFGDAYFGDVKDERKD
ncbi:hypothetical protein H311_04388, partial [Anncaliia algerae PRA109]